ncbi:MAG TPA: hypothetical protein VKA51_09160 [Rubrobacteraceae bacterium]|nr:hypothetical protein [Rubrobacteraceae bacterium]
MDGNLVRLGGLFGLVSALVMIPAYLVGYPDAPGSLAEADLYFDAGPGAFVFFNGVLPLFHVLLFPVVPRGAARDAAKVRGRRRGALLGGAGGRDRVRGALGSGVRG